MSYIRLLLFVNTQSLFAFITFFVCLFILKASSAGTYTISQCPEDAAIAVTSTKESALTLTIHLTSPLVRTEQESKTEEEGSYCMLVQPPNRNQLPQA